jgi:hypothetical protein
MKTLSAFSDKSRDFYYYNGQNIALEVISDKVLLGLKMPKKGDEAIQFVQNLNSGITDNARTFPIFILKVIIPISFCI